MFYGLFVEGSVHYVLENNKLDLRVGVFDHEMIDHDWYSIIGNQSL